ncbi:hypothetical protein DAEQUDRAFT_769207 [Daedalea quercina L-15889]|uniref:Uncharacterized protein n=1 Tax=Daedalea quercina L-15889 TaxID=1314783 RepID=A0A165LX43_9APHY|nr:hypothetical protein DAEQUDRAFT_769207 [Daedalea quercina L-15889]
MFPLVEDEGRTEYPFPPMPPTATDAVEPSSSSSDTLPSGPSRIGSRSSRSSPAPRPNSPRDRDYAYDREQSWAGTGGKAKLLARLMTRSERDANHYRSMFMLANERLEHETRRADDAEQRAIDTLQRLRQARDQIAQAQSDVARANEETRLWKLRLDEAQREILRAQEIVDRLEQDKLDAEAEAARARTLARKLKEEKVIARAREEGRRQGFQEGLSRGREMSYYEARAAGIPSRNEPRRYAQRPAVVDDMSDEEEEEQEENATGSGSQPEEIIPITRSPPPQTWRPSSRSEGTRSTMRSPPRQPTSPIRVRSPHIAAPSPVHPNVPTPATTPNPIPIPDPGAGRSQSRRDGRISPIPIHNAAPSPSHPPVDIPPDNWIPYMSSDNVIELPPPHEMTKPLTPRASSPSLIDSTMRVPANYEQPVRARDYAYTAGAGPSQGQPPHTSHGSAFSPLSKASTTISQYEIVSSRGDQGRSASHSRSRSDVLAGLREMISSPSGRSKTPARQSREDRPIQSPRGPRPKELMTEVYNAAHPETFARSQTPARSKTPARPETPGRSGTLDKLFKKRWRNRTSTSSGVPDIQVESPSSKQVSPVTSAGTISQPHMLSPEASHADLPSLEVMQSYIAPELMDSKDKRGLPPLPGANSVGPDGVPILQEGQLPPGFIPFTPSIHQPVIPPSSRSNTPYTPIYAERDQSSSSRTDSTRTRTTSSSRRSAGGGTPKPATPKPRSGSTYEEAPLPPGVVYPGPPGRGPTPGTTTDGPLPLSPSRSTTPGGRKGSLSAALSPLSIPQLLSPLRMPL